MKHLYSALLSLILLCGSAIAKPVDLQHEWNAGNAAFDREDWQTAVKHYDRILAADSEEGAAYHNRALARVAGAHGGELDMHHLSAGAPASAYQASIKDLSEAIRLDSQNADAYMWRAIFRKAVNDLDNAVADADKAVALNPEWAEAATAVRGTRMVWWIYYAVAATVGLLLLVGGSSLVRTLMQVAKAEKAAKAGL